MHTRFTVVFRYCASSAVVREALGALEGLACAVGEVVKEGVKESETLGVKEAEGQVVWDWLAVTVAVVVGAMLEAMALALI